MRGCVEGHGDEAGRDVLCRQKYRQETAPRGCEHGQSQIHYHSSINGFQIHYMEIDPIQMVC